MVINKIEDAVHIARALLTGGIIQVEILVRGNEEQQKITIAAIRSIRQNLTPFVNFFFSI